MQTNTDEHDPEFCFENYNSLNDTERNTMCPLDDDDFEGAPPTVIILLSAA